MEWYYWLIIVIAVMLLIGQFIGSFIGFKYIIPMKPQSDSLLDRDLPNTHFGKYEGLIRESFDFLEKLDKKDLYITSRDGLKLHGCYIDNNSSTTVVFTHGYRSRPFNDFSLPMKKMYLEGYNIFYLDQRCHGESEGKYVSFGIKERLDLVDWVNLINETYKPTNIVLYGMSMGCATTSMSLPLMPNNVRSAVLDCGFSSIFKLMVIQTRKMIKVNAVLSVIVMDLYCRLFAGFSMFKTSSKRSLRKTSIPCFFIHGKTDSVVPFKHGVENYKSGKMYKEYAFVEGAEHGISYLVANPDLEKKIVDFVSNTILNK